MHNIHHLGLRFPSLFYPAVFIAAWVGGLWGGIGATLLAAALDLWFSMPAHASLDAIGISGYVSASLLAVVGIAFSLISERIRARHAEYHVLFDQAGDGIIIVYADGRCVNANPKYCALLGRPREEVIGAPLSDYVVGAVLGIVRAHKGAIFVDSAVGVGTTVRVLLPAAEPA